MGTSSTCPPPHQRTHPRGTITLDTRDLSSSYKDRSEKIRTGLISSPPAWRGTDLTSALLDPVPGVRWRRSGAHNPAYRERRRATCRGATVLRDPILVIGAAGAEPGRRAGLPGRSSWPRFRTRQPGRIFATPRCPLPTKLLAKHAYLRVLGPSSRVVGRVPTASLGSSTLPGRKLENGEEAGGGSRGSVGQEGAKHLVRCAPRSA